MKSDSSKRNSRTMLRRSGGRFCSLTRGKKIIERGISSASKHHEQRTTIICRREKETKVLARPKLGCNVPRCKSNEVLCYGKRYNKSVKKQKYNCLACGIYFSHDNKKEKLDAHEILGSWVGGHSLRMIAERYRVSKSTVYNNVRRELSAVYDWRDSGKNRKMKLSGVLSVDAAFFNRGKWVLWIATDPILGFVLAYDLREMTEHEDYYNSVLSFLYDIKETLDYYPRLLLFDDDMWIEKAVRNVLNRSNYTLCTFHLQKNLDKRLPTKQLQK